MLTPSDDSLLAHFSRAPQPARSMLYQIALGHATPHFFAGISGVVLIRGF